MTVTLGDLAVRFGCELRGDPATIVDSVAALSQAGPRSVTFLANPKYVYANTGDANLLNLLALPFVGVNTDFGTKSFRAGWAAYIPFGGMANWDRDRGIPDAPGSMECRCIRRSARRYAIASRDRRRARP